MVVIAALMLLISPTRFEAIQSELSRQAGLGFPQNGIGIYESTRNGVTQMAFAVDPLPKELSLVRLGTVLAVCSRQPGKEWAWSRGLAEPLRLPASPELEKAMHNLLSNDRVVRMLKGNLSVGLTEGSGLLYVSVAALPLTVDGSQIVVADKLGNLKRVSSH